MYPSSSAITTSVLSSLHNQPSFRGDCRGCEEFVYAVLRPFRFETNERGSACRTQPGVVWDEGQTRLLRCARQTNNVELANHAWNLIEKVCQLPTRQSMHGRMVGRMEASEERMTLLLKVLGDLNNEGRGEEREGERKEDQYPVLSADSFETDCLDKCGLDSVRPSPDSIGTRCRCSDCVHTD
ncbi:hypothetical protein BLNAU_3618 [Blattamonas nauphoetae]|uniref:Uncharacterized protein n=1 Tax=Blattamonas nauphoetae TaxID=2049346 RepID=A0ABQ9YCL1_9EUKA|nr:hypothetical protein BLNAU_3618 [Blattamonas nauphoetae]